MVVQTGSFQFNIMTEINVEIELTFSSSGVRFVTLTGAWGTELSLCLGGGNGSTGNPAHKSFKDAMLLRYREWEWDLAVIKQLLCGREREGGVWYISH